MCYFQAAMAVVALASGAIQAGNERAAGKANQQIAENNARLSEQQGKDESVLLARESQKAAWRTRAMIGNQKAAMAANNLDFSQGTAFDILSETAMFGGAEQSAIAADAARKSWAYNAEALNYRNQGRLARFEANSRATGTILNSVLQAGSFLSTGSGGFLGMGGGKGKG